MAKLYNVSLDYLLSTDETVEEIKENNSSDLVEEKEENKIISSFNCIIPIGITLAYLIMGCCFNLWHPGWVLFLTIPLFYIITDAIDK